MDYSDVMDQFRRQDHALAELIASGLSQDDVNIVLRNFEVDFLRFFRADMNRRSRERCRLQKLLSMQKDLHEIIVIRQTTEGISLDRVIGLEARSGVLNFDMLP